MDARALFLTQLALECIGIAPGALLVRSPGPCPDEIACVYAVTFPDGTLETYLRGDLPQGLLAALRALPPGALRDDRERVVGLLEAETGCGDRVRALASYVFPKAVSPAPQPAVVCLDAGERALIEAYDARLDPSRWPVYAVVLDGRIASACSSSREDDRAAEAWVQTQPYYQRRGLGRQVTAAWAQAVRARGKVPFYSHDEDNAASRALARGLGLIPFVRVVSYS